MEREAFFKSKIKDRLTATSNYRFNPGLYENLFWRPCTVKILMVADSFLYFSDEDFGLSDLIGILKNENLSYVRFDITVAHRSNPSDARMGAGNADISGSIKSFKFDDADDFDPNAYDQVWLFAAQRSDRVGSTWTNKVSDSELRVLTQFMDAGGGVFATGDHEDLGCAMGGFLPRVRQMRRWFFDEVGPNGEGLAPPVDGPGRFDTNREGHDAGYQFNDQSDDIPQPIVPKMYSTRTGPFFTANYPHPVLCGPNGKIQVLPDHPHESQCTLADRPDATETLDGVTFTEFPAATGGGIRPLPEVIATSTVLGGNPSPDKFGTTVARTFGAISAYDGHRADVGRVVCDATWHHFININLTGSSAFGTPPNKTLGFLASAAGQAVYEEIKAYFINIALWISPQPKLNCMRNWGIYTVMWTDRLPEVFNLQASLDNARLIDYYIIGRHARNAIGRFASQCQSLRWTWDFVLEEYEFLPFIDMGDPWRPTKEDIDESTMIEDLQPLDLVNLSWVGDVALGGAIYALNDNAYPMDQKILDRFDETGDEITRKGASVALKKAMPFIEKSLKAMGSAARDGFRDGDTKQTKR